MRRNLRAAIVFGLFLVGWVGWRVYDARPIVDPQAAPPDPAAVAVLELFTSEGCSSCPPADELLGEVADAPGVFALSFHVDYWDHLGWQDPYGQRAFSLRQRGYSARLSGGRVYTPQLVINGVEEAIGSSRSQVRNALDRALARPAPATVALERAGATLTYRVEGAPAGSLVYAAEVLPSTDGQPPHGENGGARWPHTNVVLALHGVELGEDGAGAFQLETQEPTVVFVQDAESLAVLGGARVEAPPPAK